jgi:hypothetical protein
MSFSKNVRSRISAKNNLELFSFNDIVKKDDSQLAVMQELSRLCAKGDIERLRNGIYFKPKESRFGVLKPSESDMLKFLLFDKGKRIGYVSGQRSFNYLGLTSQIPSVITIATDQQKRSGVFAGLRIRYVKAYGRVSKDDVRLLQILDSLKDVDKILDARVSESLRILSDHISKLSDIEKRDLIRIAQSYPARVKALVGAIMSRIWENNPKGLELLILLRAKIKDASRFEYPNKNKVLREIKYWNIYETA